MAIWNIAFGGNKGGNKMIKLEDLKEGDIVYLSCGYHWFSEITITREKYPFEYQDLSKPTVYAIIGKSKGRNNHYLFSYDEGNLYRTKEEAKEVMELLKQQQKEFLRDKDNLIEFLFTRCNSMLPDADRKLIKEIIEERKED